MKRITTLSLIALTLIVATGCKPRIRVKPRTNWVRPAVRHTIRRSALDEQKRREQTRIRQIRRQSIRRRGAWGR